MLSQKEVDFFISYYEQWRKFGLTINVSDPNQRAILFDRMMLAYKLNDKHAYNIVIAGDAGKNCLMRLVKYFWDEGIESADFQEDIVGKYTYFAKKLGAVKDGHMYHLKRSAVKENIYDKNN